MTTQKKRDLSIELMRLVLMFMICMIHAVGYVPARWNHWLTNVCFVGVLGFVLISGYFGIQFSWKKVFRLEGIGIGCATTVVALSLLFVPANRLVSSAIGEIVRLWKGYWFIHAYVVMMVLAPLAENLFRRGDGPGDLRLIFRAVCPFVLMVYGWSFLMLVPGIQHVVPRTSGFEPFSGITLFAVYLVGRLYRELNLDLKLKARWVVPVTIVAGIFSACVIPPTNNWGGIFARYNSPTLLVFSVGFFWGFRKMVKMWLAKYSSVQLSFPLFQYFNISTLLPYLGPSILSVYLIHCNDYGSKFFAWMGGCLTDYGCGVYSLSFVLAITVFLGGFLLDIPRRLLMGMCIALFLKRSK